MHEQEIQRLCENCINLSLLFKESAFEIAEALYLQDIISDEDWEDIKKGW